MGCVVFSRHIGPRMDVSPSSLPQIIDASRPRRVHLVGIAGNGMRALADVLLGWGWP